MCLRKSGSSSFIEKSCSAQAPVLTEEVSAAMRGSHTPKIAPSKETILIH
ncbi:hypothetical protein INQ98_00895 [Chlamydia suis]|nr:hypothetical protein INQ98_00895 [Chlamydia suis]